MKVSMVSVSRTAGLPHSGQVVCFQVGCNFNGLSPVGFHSTSSGSSTGSWSSGTGYSPMLGAVNHGDRRAPIALAADQPIAQAIIDCSLANPLLFQPLRHLGFGDIAWRTAKLTRMDHRAIIRMIQSIPVELTAPQHFHQGTGRDDPGLQSS